MSEATIAVHHNDSGIPSVDAEDFAQLAELQLALVGGGIGTVVFA